MLTYLLLAYQPTISNTGHRTVDPDDRESRVNDLRGVHLVYPDEGLVRVRRDSHLQSTCRARSSAVITDGKLEEFAEVAYNLLMLSVMHEMFGTNGGTLNSRVATST